MPRANSELKLGMRSCVAPLWQVTWSVAYSRSGDARPRTCFMTLSSVRVSAIHVKIQLWQRMNARLRPHAHGRCREGPMNAVSAQQLAQR